MDNFSIPYIPGLDATNPGITGLDNSAGISAFGIPGLQSLPAPDWFASNANIMQERRRLWRRVRYKTERWNNRDTRNISVIRMITAVT